MKFHPGRHPDEAVIQPESFDAPIEVKGLAADALSGLFHGSTSARAHWKPGLTVTAGLAEDNYEPSEPATFETDLPDGLATLHSGAPGTVQVQSHHSLADTLLSQSLGLLLAQQWARSGLLMVHAAAFEIDGRGILAMGDKGAGKSVLTASAMAAGARVVSDDWVMTGPGGSQRFKVERMREFLMLRHSQACDRILARLPQIQARNSAARPKAVIRIAEDDAQPHFTRECDIHELWLVRRPKSGRAQASRIEDGPSTSALSAIMRATMPVLFSKRFEAESARIHQTTRNLVAQSRCRLIEPGLDLVDRPKDAFSKLF